MRAPAAVFVLGRGSNLLVADEGFDGIVLHLGAGFAGLDLPQPADATPERAAIRPWCGRGRRWRCPVLARRVADAGWSGLSWAVGVPGSVGGAVRMNAGGHGSDMASCLVRYSWVDLFGEAGGTDDVGRLAYGYRSSSVTAVAAGGGGGAGRHAGIGRGGAGGGDRHRQMAARAPARAAPTPARCSPTPRATRPGRLIEAAGLKGFRMGTAHVSEKHANFIQADKDGRADDVHALMEHVRAVVAERAGSRCAAEVRLLGFGDGKTGPVDGTGRR